MPKKITGESVYPARATDHGPDGWTIELRDWPEVAAAGATFAEAVRDALGALEEAALTRAAEGQDIPAPSRLRKDETRIALTPLAATKLALNGWQAEFGRGAQAELARRTGWDKSAVRDVLALKQGRVSTDRMVEAAAAAGFMVTTGFHTTGHGRMMRAAGSKPTGEHYIDRNTKVERATKLKGVRETG